MKDRLLEFLKAENKSSAQLAEEIGVQASGISHIISGRNNPSLDFILKMLDKYKFLSTDWLLFGRGSMYKDAKMQSLFDNITDLGKDGSHEPTKTDVRSLITDIQQVDKENKSSVSLSHDEESNSEVIKIVWFYSNSTFEEYFPR